jgi:predicted dehydrogenase
MTDTIKIGMIGYKFMGKAHSNAYRQVSSFFDVPLQPEMTVLCGRDQAAVQAAATQMGWQETANDWRKVIARDDIGLIDISTPGDSHYDIAIAAAEAGKHILCEKPLANTLDEARKMQEAVERAGVVAMVNFNYRRVPAIQLAKRLIDDGRIGDIRHWRAVYLQDWIIDPEFPLVWRLQKDLAGSGALGDIGAHIADLARYLVGEIVEVNGLLSTFIKERPLLAETTGAGLGAAARQERGQVTVDDAALFLARFENGAVGSFEATRFATGRRNRNSFEINGSRGSIVFDLERMNELQFYSLDDADDAQGFRNILVSDGTHPYMNAWWPAGHIIGWEHTFTHTVYDLLNGIAANQSPAPTFADGVRCQAILDAVERSAANGSWEKPEYT